jgi:hypothetical protein
MTFVIATMTNVIDGPLRNPGENRGFAPPGDDKNHRALKKVKSFQA